MMSKSVSPVKRRRPRPGKVKATASKKRPAPMQDSGRSSTQSGEPNALVSAFAFWSPWAMLERQKVLYNALTGAADSPSMKKTSRPVPNGKSTNGKTTNGKTKRKPRA